MPNIKVVEEVIILGTGPAGLTAALYAARADLNPLVLTGTEIGGQAAITDRIENYPGFPKGVGGSELADLFQKSSERFGARLEYDSATEVDFAQHPFKINTYCKEYLAKTVILATGASSNRLNIPGEKEFLGKGVSYCATCDGWFFKGKKVAVIGGGDSALEEAIFLTRYATTVKVIHRRNSLRAGAILQRRAKENLKITFIWDTIVKEVNGIDGVEYLQLQNLKDDSISKLDIDGVFIFIGHTPSTALFKGQLELDEEGYIIADNRYRTNIPGIFTAGEATDPYYRQVVTSAGMGASAAIEAIRYLEKIENN
jgi:thioredoxin reductase (NADPH)